MKAVMALLLALATGSSWAALGGSRADFTPHLVSARTMAPGTAPAASTLVESTLDTGTVVDEYADSTGTVFAVAWSGPFLPDLKQLLGSHFAAMAAHAANRPRRGALALDEPDLHLVSTGHMGAFQGQAWLPARLPAGFTPADIQ